MRAERRPQVHYLRENKGERTPHRLLVLDAESFVQGDPRGELHTLRLWCARLIRRHGRQPTRPRSEDFEGTTVEALTELVDKVTVTSETTWLFVHNLNYELALTRLPIRLTRAGWELRQHNLASDAPWAHFKKGGRSLRMADSASWLPLSNDRIGSLLGLAKPKLPDFAAGDAEWRLRCRADVDITATAVCRLMDIWDTLALGWWSLTGPATGWNSMLHMRRGPEAKTKRTAERADGYEVARETGGRTVIDPDPAQRAFEREAIYSGRRDLWRVGELPEGPYVELDMRNTHLSICAAFPLPARRIKTFDTLQLDDWRIRSQVVSLIARCRVRTAEPRYPYRARQAILHPVGEFETVLCGPELADASRRGDLLSVGAGIAYRLSDQMQPWANWALSVVDDRTGEVDPLLQATVKAWGRSVPGRWGMMISRAADQGDSFVEDWALELATTGTPPRKCFVFHFDHHWTELIRDQEADDSFPAVLAHIQSWCRLLLNRALAVVPPQYLVACNTEGFWVHDRGLYSLLARGAIAGGPNWESPSVVANAESVLSAAVAPLTVRLKSEARQLRLLSPQHLEVDGRPRHAGVPSSAEPTGPDSFEFLTWPKLKGQIERGDPTGYVREARTVNLAGVSPSRFTYEDGCTAPVEAAWTAATATVLLPPSQGSSCEHGAGLRTVQHAALKGLLPLA